MSRFMRHSYSGIARSIEQWVYVLLPTVFVALPTNVSLPANVSFVLCIVYILHLIDYLWCALCVFDKTKGVPTKSKG